MTIDLERRALDTMEADLEELLAAPIIRRLMQKDGVDPQSIRTLIATVARAMAKAH